MSNLIRLPGLIDIHVHLRDPGETYKEDFYTGTCAALAGGVTTVFDMPNNIEPIFSEKRLLEKIDIAKRKAVCDWGLYFGTDGRNTTEFEKIADKVVGLKLYLSLTTGQYLVGDEELIKLIFQKWPKTKVLIVHAEGDRVDLAIKLAIKHKNKLHITHVSTRQSLEKIIEGKKDKLNITSDVTPHHLFLTQEQISGKVTPGVAGIQGLPRGGGIRDKNFYLVKPPLTTKQDQEFLWQNLNYIDCIASDHGPHTISEKQNDNPPYGMPGLETMLPLLLQAVTEKRLNIEEIIRLTNTNSQKIFELRQDNDTFVEVDLDERYMIKNKDLFTKCRWTPYEGWEGIGKVRRVYIRGTKVFENGKVLVKPGFGKQTIVY